ncbi:Transcription factor bHLH131 [Linum grandiflorum]
MVSLQQIREAQRVSSFYKSRAHPNSIDYRQVASSLNAYKQRTTSCKEEAKQMSKEKHKHSERDRRSRVSSLYSSLRMILPTLVKKNKASVLHETIRQVRRMNSAASALNAACRGGSDCLYPGGDDHVTVDKAKDKLLKVTLSCNDRSGLMVDIGKAVRSVKAKVVRAEMVTIGGRTKCVFRVKGVDGFEGRKMLSMAVNAAARCHNKPVACEARNRLGEGVGLTSNPRDLGLIHPWTDTDSVDST